MLPNDPAGRKGVPLYSGAIRYFPAALAGVARCSVAGSKQHHGSAELYHDRSKSGDEADAMLRHLLESEVGDGVDTDGVLHIDKFAWRALSLAQKYHERRDAPVSPAARNVAPRIVSESEAAAIKRDLMQHDESRWPKQRPIPVNQQDED